MNVIYIICKMLSPGCGQLLSEREK